LSDKGGVFSKEVVKSQVRVRSAVITGIKDLTGTVVEATDLRAGAALVLGGLAAENTTIIEGVQHLDRGYENIESRLKMLGAQVSREII
jgi:UDP-N-acetylglucosamine 1-carboxyvinyltransferase